MENKLHFMIATPMYGGACTGIYTQSVINLSLAIRDQGHTVGTIFLSNESLIQRARNAIVKGFMDIPTATHLLFIDGDIGFRVEDVIRMINANKDIIVAPVPMKGIHWENVLRGAYVHRLAGNSISDYVPGDKSGIFNIVGMENKILDKDEEPIEVEYGGTGFMMIKRGVFEVLKPITKTYLSDRYNFSADHPIYDYFRVEIDEKTNCLLSEDYYFCQSYKKIGGLIHAAPWAKTSHLGSYEYIGDYTSFHNTEVMRGRGEL